MHKQQIISVTLLAVFGSATIVFFSIFAHFRNDITNEVCEFFPIESTELADNGDFYCNIVMNHTMDCGTWEVVEVLFHGRCGKFKRRSNFDYNGRSYEGTRYVCYTDDCTWDHDDYYYERIAPMQWSGVACGVLALGAMVYSLVMMCPDHSRMLGHVGPRE